MPTKADFEAAAMKFHLAADQVGTLTAAAEDADASRILRGGTLGRQVPERITSSAATAAMCQGLIESAAETCLERAAIIGDYEVELEIYDIMFEQYLEQMVIWQRQFDAWWIDPTYMVPHPGYEPEPPTKPVPPPDWAEVRRP